MPAEFEFDYPYELIRGGDEWFMLRAHGINLASYSVKAWGSESNCIRAAWMRAYSGHTAYDETELVTLAVAWAAKAAVLKSRGKANSLHDIMQAAEYLETAAKVALDRASPDVREAGDA